MTQRKAYILSTAMILLFALAIMFAFDAYQTDGKYDGLWVFCFSSTMHRLDYGIITDTLLAILFGIWGTIVGIKLNKYFTWHWLLILLSAPLGMAILVFWRMILDYIIF